MKPTVRVRLPLRSLAALVVLPAAGISALQPAPPPPGLASSPAAEPASSPAAACDCASAPSPAGGGGAGEACWVSKVVARQDHAPARGGGLSLTSLAAIYGSSTLTEAQRELVTLGRVASTSFMCLDDRVAEPALSTPGGDLGEFVLALASYLQERDPTGEARPTQEVVDTLLLKYAETLPAGRPLVHCTDDRAISHLEAELPAENLDLTAPPDNVKEAGLLQRLTSADNQGDSHFRLMLKQPEWFQLNAFLVPMVLKAFYSLLWKQSQDTDSPLHSAPKLKLHVLVGESNPEAFLEVSSGELCHSNGMAPMLAPRRGKRSVLISHLDAVSLRRMELAAFFSRIANATPRKINRDRLHQRLDRHGWLALETTGSRIAAGLPFYTLTYS